MHIFILDREFRDSSDQPWLHLFILHFFYLNVFIMGLPGVSLLICYLIEFVHLFMRAIRWRCKASPVFISFTNYGTDAVLKSCACGHLRQSNVVFISVVWLASVLALFTTRNVFWLRHCRFSINFVEVSRFIFFISRDWTFWTKMVKSRFNTIPRGNHCLIESLSSFRLLRFLIKNETQLLKN